MAHLTLEQRYTIETMFHSGHRQTEIATVIGKHKSVVSREIKRNCDGRSAEYKHELAQRKYDCRQREKLKKIGFTAKVQQVV